MACVQRHKSEGKDKASMVKEKKNTYLERCEKVKTLLLGWPIAEGPD